MYKKELKYLKGNIVFVSRCIINNSIKIVVCSVYKKNIQYFFIDDFKQETSLSLLFTNSSKEIFLYWNKLPKYGKKFIDSCPINIPNNLECVWINNIPVVSSKES